MGENTIKLGLMPPLSGIVELYGKEITWAGTIAAAEINTSGGVLGKPLELIIQDDGSLPEPAVYAANRLIDECGCVALIGNLLSNSRIAVSSLVSEPRKIPYLNFSFYEGSISGRYFFHFAALPNQQIDKMIPYMAKHFGPKMFFAGNNYEWPRGSIDAAKRVLRREGGEIIGEEYLSIGASPDEIHKLLMAVAHSGADVFVPYFAGSDQIHLLTLFTRMGLKKRMVVVMGHYDEAMVSVLAPEVREGFYSSNTYFMSLDTPRNKRYLDLLRQLPQVNGIHPHGNGVLTNFGEGTYLCVHAFAQAVNLAGTTAAADLVPVLETIQLEGPQGTVYMDKDTHHAIVNTYLSRCNSDGTFTLIERFGQIAPLIPERYRSTKMPVIPSLPRPPSESLQRELSFISKSILEAADIAVIATDAVGTILQANRGAYDLFGYAKGELPGLAINMLVPPHFRAFHTQAIKQFVLGDQRELRMSKRGEITGYKKDGTFFPAEASISKFPSDEHEWILVVTLMDIGFRKRAEEELTWRATHDPLTNLPNRMLIKERLTNALERTRKSGHNVGLLFVDLDKFKLVNDTYGHEAGDKLLIKVAETLNANVRRGDTVARLGGDEFVILCESIDNHEVLMNLADRINTALRLPFMFEDKGIVSTASIGLSLGHGSTHTADDLLRESDTAMYASKQQGRDRWKLFSNELHTRSKQKLEIESGLRTAIEKNELFLCYQPIVASANGAIKGLEALLRWNLAGVSISPGLFIPIAEESGLIVTIGRWVFQQACRMQTKLQALYGDSAPYVSINVSVRQLNESRIVEEFESILKDTGANPHKILLEITESSIMADVDENVRILNALNALGMSVAVDDFGTGYSSLLQLLRMPVTHIKIDREFVNGLDKRIDSKLVTSAIVKMAKALDKQIIAEGVENEAQFFELSSLGADSIQGFYFYRPLEEGKLVATLAENRLAAHRMSEEIYAVAYVSRATDSTNMNEINELLRKARDFNLANAITGCLIYSSGYFLQLIEGRKEIIDSLMQRIRRDSRHTDVTTIMQGFSKNRVFGDWSMAFWDMSADAKKLAGLDAPQELILENIAQDLQLGYALIQEITNKKGDRL